MIATTPTTDRPASPLHGFRGDDLPASPGRPRGLTIAVSREAGARGGSIARKAAELLGWQVFDQELFDFLLADEPARGQLLTDVPAGAREWADAQLARLRADGRLRADPAADDGVRLVLTVAARGEAVIVGRAAGFLLPTATTLHVRVVAPEDVRVAYVGEVLRLTRAEAAAEVRARDHLRARFLDMTVHRTPADVYGYDLVLNSARLGVEEAAHVVAAAVRSKHLAPAADPLDELMGA